MYDVYNIFTNAIFAFNHFTVNFKSLYYSFLIKVLLRMAVRGNTSWSVYTYIKFKSNIGNTRAVIAVYNNGTYIIIRLYEAKLLYIYTGYI